MWLKAPGIAPDIQPYFDIQLGKQINTRQERDAILKAKGLVALGPDEIRRTDSQNHAEPENIIDKALFKDAAEKAWADVRAGNVPLEAASSTDGIDVDGGPTVG